MKSIKTGVWVVVAAVLVFVGLGLSRSVRAQVVGSVSNGTLLVGTNSPFDPTPSDWSTAATIPQNSSAYAKIAVSTTGWYEAFLWCDTPGPNLSQPPAGFSYNLFVQENPAANNPQSGIYGTYAAGGNYLIFPGPYCRYTSTGIHQMTYAVLECSDSQGTQNCTASLGADPITVVAPGTTITTVTPSIVASPNSVALSTTVGSYAGSGQPITFTSTSGAAITWNALSSVSWMTVPSSGSGNTNIILTPNAATLPPGLYTGTINFSFTGGGSQLVTVNLTVNRLAAGPATVSPLSLAFTASQGSSSAAQVLTFRNLSTDATLTSACTTSPCWLAPSNLGSTLILDSTTGLLDAPESVSVNSASLAQGNYTGSITMSGSASGLPITVPVTLAVGPAAVISYPTPTASISASQSSITAGQSTTLTWSSVNATVCTASGPSSFSGIMSTNGSLSVSPASSATYSITCAGAGGSSAPASATVTVTAGGSTIPSSATLSINGSTVSNRSFTAGQAWTLSLSTTGTSLKSAPFTFCYQNTPPGGGAGAVSCTSNFSTTDVNGNWTLSGTFANSSVGTDVEWVTFPSSGTASAPFTFTVTSPGGSTVTTTAPAPTVSISANQASIAAGQPVTVAWSSTNATSCSGSSSPSGLLGGSVNTAGTITDLLSTPGTYTYSITCSGAGGSSAPASATVNVTGSVSAVTIPSVAPSLNITVGPNAPISGKITAGSTGVPFLTFTIANPSSENVKVTSVALIGSFTGVMPFANVALWSGNTEIGGASYSGSNTFTFSLGSNTSLVIPSMNSVVLTVKSDIPSSVSESGIVGSVGSLSLGNNAVAGFGASSNLAVAPENGNASGAVFTVVAPASSVSTVAPSATLSINGSTAPSGSFTAGKSWTLSLSTNDTLPNTYFTFCYENTPPGSAAGGTSCTSNFSTTDGNGNWTLPGTFANSSVGTDVEWVTFPSSGLSSNHLTFSVAGVGGNTTPTAVTVFPTSLNFVLSQGSTGFTTQTLNLTNWPSSGGSVTSVGGGGWLAVSPPSVPTNGASNVTVDVTASGIAPGTYSASIAVTANGQTINVPVALTVTQTQGSTNSSIPSAPQSFTATPGNGQVALSWSAPSSIGSLGVTNYAIDDKLSGSSGYGIANALLGPSATSTVITGLTNGMGYDFEIFAESGNFTSPAALATGIVPMSTSINNNSSAPSVSPMSLSFSATQGLGAPNSQLLFITNYPSSGGSVTVGSGQSWLNVSQPTLEGGNYVSGVAISPAGGDVTLAPGTYSGSIVITVPGTSPVTVPVTLTVASSALAPSAPQSFAAVPGDGQVMLTWSAPASPGLPPFTTYILSVSLAASPANAIADVNLTGVATSKLVSGLENGTSYDFQIVASNGSSLSPAATITGIVPTAQTAPTAPSIIVTSASNSESQAQVAAGSTSLPFFSFTVSNPSSEGVELQSVALEETPVGSSGYLPFTDLSIWDDGTQVSGIVQPIGGSVAGLPANVNFFLLPSFVIIPAGGTVTLTVEADVPSQASESGIVGSSASVAVLSNGVGGVGTISGLDAIESGDASGGTFTVTVSTTTGIVSPQSVGVSSSLVMSRQALQAELTQLIASLTSLLQSAASQGLITQSQATSILGSLSGSGSATQ